MSNENNNGYQTGDNGDGQDLFSLFDGFSTVSAPETDELKTQEIKTVSESRPEENTVNEKEDVNAKKKKSSAFTVLCVVLSVCIAACCVLSAFNISTAAADKDVTEPTVENTGNPFSVLYAKYNATDYPAHIPESLMKVYAANNDVFGWLYLPGTNINTPVLRARDNGKYLRYDFYGNHTNYGCAYADFRCFENKLSSNIVIYGHNMPSGTHFYDINRYEDIEWYKKHPTIKLTTLYGEYTYLIYTAFYTTGQTKYNGGYFFNYIYPNMGRNSLKGYIEQIDQRAIYITGVTANENDKFITLSTCNHSLDSDCGRDIDGRLVVVGRLMHGGENGDVDTSKAKANPDYRRPQIWYDSKGKKNPYASSVKWTPTAK